MVWESILWARSWGRRSWHIRGVLELQETPLKFLSHSTQAKILPTAFVLCFSCSSDIAEKSQFQKEPLVLLWKGHLIKKTTLMAFSLPAEAIWKSPGSARESKSQIRGWLKVLFCWSSLAYRYCITLCRHGLVYNNVGLALAALRSLELNAFFVISAPYGVTAEMCL